MTRTIYRCDRCKAEAVNDTGFLCRINFNVGLQNGDWGGCVVAPGWGDWCRKCHLEVGTLQPDSGKSRLYNREKPNKPLLLKTYCGS